MREKIRYITSKRTFHIAMIIVIISIILFVLGIIILRYNVEGESNMPFNLSKITVISSSEGTDIEENENKWAFDINQNNDIYVYIEKNKNYNKEEAIKAVTINNIKVEKQVEKGIVNLYKPNSLDTGGMFSNKPENLAQEIQFTGALESDIKNLKISNQGGIIVFRYANDKLAQYISNDEEINHIDLLKKANITNEDLKAKIEFDFCIQIESGKEYKTNISLDVPVDGIIENGTGAKEITNTDDIIFKRIKN